MKLTKKTLKKLGLDPSGIEFANSVDDLVKQTPAMVTAKACSNSAILIDGSPINIYSGDMLVMSLNVYLKAKRSLKAKRKSILMPKESKQFNSMFRRYRGEDLTDKTLLIWRSGGIGDLCFSQPLIRYIKEKWPTCEILYATAPRFLSTFHSWGDGLVDKILPIPYTHYPE